MSMIDQFQKLDDLIFEHTQPPVRTVLRNQLALTREQIEAYQAASDRQDQTLAAQIEAISKLQEYTAKLETSIKQLTPQPDWLAEEHRKYREFIRKHKLNYGAKK